MKNVKSLSRESLIEIVGNVRDLLFMDEEETGMVFDPDKEWDSPEVLSQIAETLNRHGLRPSEVVPVESNGKAAFEVSIQRTGYGATTLVVHAGSEEEAEMLALEKARDHEFTEKSAEYEAESVVKVKKAGKNGRCPSGG